MITRNPNHVDHFAIEGYADLGWQLWDTPELNTCEAAGHKRRQVDNSLYLHRGTDVIYICDECKNLHHVDMSD